jgi:hypothetical protein
MTAITARSPSTCAAAAPYTAADTLSDGDPATASCSPRSSAPTPGCASAVLRPVLLASQPAGARVGRGTAELLTFGEYRTQDLSELSYGRIANRAPLIECALI